VSTAKPIIAAMIAGTLALGATAAAAARDTVTIKLEGTAADAVAFKAKVTGTAGKGDRLILAGDEQHCASTEVKEATHKKTTAFLPFSGIRVHPVFSHTYSLDSSGPLLDDNYLCAYLVKPRPKVTSPPPTIAVAILHYERT
jgi:hypothetical protein